MISAIEVNVTQLKSESEAYKDAVTAEEEKQRRIRGRKLDDHVCDDDPNNYVTNTWTEKTSPTTTNSITSSYAKEIETLTHAITVQEQELELLQGQLREQGDIVWQISQQEEQLQQELNSLEFYFYHVWTRAQPVLTNFLQRAQDDFNAVSSARLPLMLFDVRPSFPPPMPQQPGSVSSDLALHKKSSSSKMTNVNYFKASYSTINHLRLAHKPCIKQSLAWNEINAAWSQAAQLIFFVGGEKCYFCPDCLTAFPPLFLWALHSSNIILSALHV